MPELPEIASRARVMSTELQGKIITGIEVTQPKCLNVSLVEFGAGLQGARLGQTTCRGKWLFTETNQGWFLLNLGMGGEIRLATRSSLPEKYRLVFDFSDESCLAVNFWWFGYAHYVRLEGLASHTMTAKLGPNAVDISPNDLLKMTRRQKAGVKAFLLDQKNLAGIGNAYIHDILFRARLHPLRSPASMSDAEVERLAHAIHDSLQSSIDKGGAFYEVGLHGEKGGFSMQDILIAYKEGQVCPLCGTAIVKIKTGNTSSYICPNCQPI
jgi:formamidopyrimidine-DNA glycosylase